MSIVVLDQHELALLKDYQLNAAYPSARRRAMALVMLHHETPEDVVAAVTDRSVWTLHRWAALWSKFKMASLYTGHIGNRNAAKLSSEQWEQLKKVLQASPKEQGIPAEFWSLPRLKDYIAAEFSIEFSSDSSYHALLHHAGLSFKLPTPVDQRRAPDSEVEARMEQVRHEVNEALEAGHLVFSSDEVRIEHEAITRRIWCTQGVRTPIKVDRTRKSQSYIGFLNQTNGSVELSRLDWQNTDTIIDALTTLTEKYPNKKITIVWDNAAWHRSKKLRSHLGPGNRFENIHLVWLPPYCPDHNPIEHVWNEAKHHISNQQRLHFNSTRNAFETYITTNNFPYRL